MVEGIPAGSFVQDFQSACGIAINGRADKEGYPANSLKKLYFVKLTKGYRPGLPIIVQKTMFSLAASTLQITGRKKVPDGYTRKN